MNEPRKWTLKGKQRALALAIAVVVIGTCARTAGAARMAGAGVGRMAVGRRTNEQLRPWRCPVTVQADNERERAERKRSVDKAVDGAMLLAFYGYLNHDQETIDVANVGLAAVGYPLLRPVR